MKHQRIMLVWNWITARMLMTIMLVRSDEEGINFRDVIPSNYSHLRPPNENGTAATVLINMRDINIRSVDESDMSFSVSIELWQVWNDSRLLYPEWANERAQILDAEWIKHLWHPNLYFVNAVEGRMNNIITPSSFLWMIKHPMKFYFICRLVLKLICIMELHDFPHDRQSCGVQMASSMFSDKEVYLDWLESENYKTKEFSSLQQFKIESVKQVRCYLGAPNRNISCLESRVVLVRRSGYFLINVYIPTVLIVAMSMLTFWIPSDAVPARITLGVTSLLTIITKQYQASMPSVSYVVALNVWLSCCIAFVFFSLLEYATVIALTAKKTPATFGPRADLELPMVLLKSNGTWATKQCWSNPKKQDNAIPRRMDYCSRIFFPASFIIFCLVYWRHYGSNN